MLSISTFSLEGSRVSPDMTKRETRFTGLLGLVGSSSRATAELVDVQGANRAPRAAVSASPSFGDVPLEVSFDGSGSSDPDFGDAVTSYLWNFGDGSPDVETTTSTANHTYTGAGTYTATLTVRDESGAEDTATVRVDAGNQPPEPTISSPTQDQLFKVGEKIVLRGSATDPQDGQLADGALSWQVFQHHAGDHTHPFLPPTPGNDVEIVTPASWSDGKEHQHDIVTGTTPSSYKATFKACTKTENLTTGETLTGTSAPDVICGLGGNDTVRALAANDIIEGMGANDILYGGGRAHKVTGGGGTDNLYGEGGNDALNSRDGVSGNDSLNGGTGTDTKVTDPTEKSIVEVP